jgi:hypothetical protein
MNDEQQGFKKPNMDPLWWVCIVMLIIVLFSSCSVTEGIPEPYCNSHIRKSLYHFAWAQHYEDKILNNQVDTTSFHWMDAYTRYLFHRRNAEDELDLAVAERMDEPDTLASHFPYQ